MTVMHTGVQPLNAEIIIRHEVNADISAIDTLNCEAFDGHSEAKLVNVLRERGEIVTSLVAAYADNVVGHVVASQIKIDGNEIAIVGIGPIAVEESHRNQGIGASLMKSVIEDVKKQRYIAAVLLGNPKYYSRFGFQTARNFELDNEYGAIEEFMAIELQSNALTEICGTVQYSQAFALCNS